MNKTEKYELLTSQICSLIAGETDAVAVMSNVAAAIHQTMGFWWTGFYRVVGDELLLGPFQGPVACMHIAFGKGVCGTAWKQASTVIVPDVECFPGHIACSSESRSEIVVPVFGKCTAQGDVCQMDPKDVVGVLDIDSAQLDTFDETDRRYLEEICRIVGSQWGF